MKVSMRLMLIVFFVIGLLVLSFVVVYGQTNKTNAVSEKSDSEKPVLYWYDPMVPEQHFDKPGKSPFMDMQLVAKYADASNDNSVSAVTIDKTIRQNLGLRIALVEKQQMSNAIRGSARLTENEHHRYSVDIRTEANIEQLLVRTMGESVTAGQKLAEIYAPELLAAQRKYLALTQLYDAKNPERKVARERLHWLGMMEADIDTITHDGKVMERIGVYAPASGIVTEHAAHEGAHVDAGARLMTIVSWDSLWLLIDIPEREALQVAVGQNADIQLDSQPGVPLHAPVEFIYPDLDLATRSLRVRISLDNPDLTLRPGMYAQVTLHTQSREVLTIPSEAVIVTGTRSVVIVQENDHFRPADVTTGNEQDGRTEILSGLKAGETVIASGQFLIDSEASLSGVLARMTPATTPGAQP